MVARLSLESPSNSIAIITYGSVLPTSDVGPFLLNGVSWYVWDVGTGAYVAQTVTPESLRYVAQNAAPDHAKYIFWIALDGSGKAQSIQYYYSGAWHDIYEDKFASYSTTTAMNAAISAAIGSASLYPAAALLTGDQTVAVDGSHYKVLFDSPFIDTGSNYAVATSQYIAPVNGVYQVNANLQIDNDTADPATLELGLRVGINGNTVASEYPTSGASVPTPSGLRWYPQVSGFINASAGDAIAIYLGGSDSLMTGNVTVAHQSQFFVNLLQRT